MIVLKKLNYHQIIFENNQNYFDLIYIDGDHETNQVHKDINNSWKILNKGGL